MIRLYKDGDTMGIGTDCTDAGEFLNQLSTMLSDMIDRKAHDGDWEFQLRFWLPQTLEICCKLKGYKADVAERRWLLAGAGEGAPLVATIDDHGKTTLPEEELRTIAKIQEMKARSQPKADG